MMIFRLRTLFALLSPTLILMTPVKCQQDVPSPPMYFFNCSENLLVSSGSSDGKVALFNVNTNTTTNVIDISDSPGFEYQQAAIDDVSRTLYLRFVQSVVTKFARYDTTDSDLPNAEPFVLDSGIESISGYDFIDGEMYFLELEPGNPLAARLVQAQVLETKPDATLHIVDVAELPNILFFVGASIAWDSCTSTMYVTAERQLLAIDITSGNIKDVVGTVFIDKDDTEFEVNFRDITVGPGEDCVLYGVINNLFQNGSLNTTLTGWVAIIDPNTGGVTPLADTKVDGVFDNGRGIASCSNPPPPVTPPDDNCYVDPYYPGRMYDSKSFLEGWYYDLGDICTHGYGGGHDDSQHAGTNEQQELATTTPSSLSTLLRAGGGTLKVCCYTNNDDAYKNKKAMIDGGDGESPNCVTCNACSTPQEVNDHCCSQARRHHGHYGGCKSKMGKDYVCCKCAHGYTCAHKSSNCQTACME